MKPTSIRARRLLLGLRLRDVSDATGLTETHLSRLERGEESASLTDRELARLASIYGTSPDELREELRVAESQRYGESQSSGS